MYYSILLYVLFDITVCTSNRIIALIHIVKTVVVQFNAQCGPFWSLSLFNKMNKKTVLEGPRKLLSYAVLRNNLAVSLIHLIILLLLLKLVLFIICNIMSTRNRISAEILLTFIFRCVNYWLRQEQKLTSLRLVWPSKKPASKLVRILFCPKKTHNHTFNGTIRCFFCRFVIGPCVI